MTSEWPQPRNCQKCPVCTQYSPPRPKFHSVSLYGRSFSRQNNWDFWFPHRIQWWIKMFVKNRKLKISKNPREYFCEDHWEVTSEVRKNSKVIWGSSSVLKFWPPYGMMLTTNWKIHKKEKIRKNNFCVIFHPGLALGRPATEIWKKCI